MFLIGQKIGGTSVRNIAPNAARSLAQPIDGGAVGPRPKGPKSSSLAWEECKWSLLHLAVETRPLPVGSVSHSRYPYGGEPGEEPGARRQDPTSRYSLVSEMSFHYGNRFPMAIV